MNEESKAKAGRLALLSSAGAIAFLACPTSAGAQTVCVPVAGITSCTVTGPAAPATLPNIPTPLQVNVQSPAALTGPLDANTAGALTLSAPNGIVSTAPNQPALSLTAGSIDANVGSLTTTANNADGALLRATNDAILTVPGTVSTSGDGSQGVNIRAGTVTANLGNVRTTGANADGVDLVSLSGPTTLNANAITTSGNQSDGALIRSAGNVDLSANTIQTSGTQAPGMDVATDPTACVALGAGGCTINGTVGSLTTNGAGSPGALVNAAGPTSLHFTSLQTNGADAPAFDYTGNPTACLTLGAGNCGTAFTAGQLVTTGNGSPGVLATIAGPMNANVDTLQTSGANAPGMDITGDPTACVQLGIGACNVDAAVGQLQTAGANSGGVVLDAPANLNTRLGNVVTQGDNSPGASLASDPAACLVLGVGGCSATVNAGSVQTGGDGSPGIGVTTAGPVDVISGPIATAGIDSPGITTATDPAACAILGSGHCGTNITAGGITTGGGGGSPGIAVLGSGPVNVDSGPVSTAGLNSPGVSAVTDPTAYLIVANGLCPTKVTTGSVQTGGDNSPGVLVSGAGPVTIATGPVSTAGADSPGITSSTDPAVCAVIGAGNCTTDVTAQSVRTGGDNSPGVGVLVGGPTTITTGAITTAGTGSPGVAATIDPAACLTLGPGSCATAITTTGPVATGGGSDGVSVTGGAGGGAGGVNTGPITISAGPIDSGGNGIGVDVGCQDVNVTARGPINAGAVGISARSACGVSVTTLPGAPVQGATGGIAVTSGTGAAITIGDRLAAGNGLALDVKGAAATILNRPTGTIVGRVDLTGNGDQLANAGRFEAIGDSDFGGGNDLLANSGTIAVRPNATAPGSVTFAGLERLSNSGLVDLRNGEVGDQLVLPGDFAGSGASTLGLDVGPGGTADRLVIGGAATGSTAVAPAGLTGRLIDGIVLVQAGAGTSPTAFALRGGMQRAGLADYTLVYDAAANDFALYGTPDQAAVEPIALADGLRQSFYRSSDAVAAHLDSAPENQRLWMVSWGAVDTRRAGFTAAPFGQARSYSLDSRQDWFGIQGGLDVDAGRFARLGITVGYQNSRLNMRGDASLFSIETVNVGAYGRIAAGPFRLDGLVKYEHAWVGLENGLYGINARAHPNNYGGRVQAALVLGTGRLSFQPFASLDYVHLGRTNPTLGLFGEELDAADGVRGKAGARVDAVVADGPSRISVYASGAAVHEFARRDRLVVTDGGASLAFVAPVVPTYAQFRVGVDIAQAARVHGFIEATADASSHYRGAGARVGLALRF